MELLAGGTLAFQDLPAGAQVLLVLLVLQVPGS
jgi:hypothetical protein